MTGAVATTIESCQLCDVVILPGDELLITDQLVSCTSHGQGIETGELVEKPMAVEPSYA